MVWQVISDVRGLAEVAPHVSKVEILSGEKMGLRRRVYDRRGNSWIEEVIAWDEGKSYSMRVDTSGRMRFRTRFEETCAQLMDNWIRVIHAREWAYRVTVATILEKKGGNVISVEPDDRVIDTANILRQNRIGSVLVIHPDGSIAGVVSERDIVRGLSDFGPGVINQPVAEIMTRKVVVAHPEDNMVLIMACMSDRRIRHLPVMDGDELVGVISIGDVVKTRIEELEGESETFRKYIEARRWRELYMEIGPAAYATMKDEIAS
jgi:CBS domain-containing protein